MSWRSLADPVSRGGRRPARRRLVAGPVVGGDSVDGFLAFKRQLCLGEAGDAVACAGRTRTPGEHGTHPFEQFGVGELSRQELGDRRGVVELIGGDLALLLGDAVLDDGPGDLTVADFHVLARQVEVVLPLLRAPLESGPGLRDLAAGRDGGRLRGKPARDTPEQPERVPRGDGVENAENREAGGDGVQSLRVLHLVERLLLPVVEAFVDPLGKRVELNLGTVALQHCLRDAVGGGVEHAVPARRACPWRCAGRDRLEAGRSSPRRAARARTNRPTRPAERLPPGPWPVR